MNETAFAHLLQKREGETLEFKRELPGSSDLAVLISAFYNTCGGTIIVGVDDQRHPVGLLRPQSVEAGITHIIRDRLDLDVLPAIEIVPYNGVHHGVAYYLVYNGVLGDRRPAGGNVLTRRVLAELPSFDGPKVIYGESCRLSGEALRGAQVTFKQIPYDLKAR